MHATRWFPGLVFFVVGCSSGGEPLAPTDTGADLGSDVNADVGSDTARDVVALDAQPVDGGADVTSADDVPEDPWGCLGRVAAPMATPGTGTIMLTAQNFQTNAGMPGLTVKACPHADVMCATPASVGTTDMMGRATLTYPLSATGFNGYFEFTGGTGTGAVVPTRSFVTFTNSNLAGNFALVTQTTFTALGAMLDSTHGGITYLTNNCLGTRTAGVSVSTMPALSGMGYYFSSGLPNPAGTQTDASGLGGFVNVPPGDYIVTGTRVSSMTRVGSRAINVRGGFLSSMNVSPTP